MSIKLKMDGEMKLKLKADGVRILSDQETSFVGGGPGTGQTGTECPSYVPECSTSTNSGTCISCTNTCPTNDGYPHCSGTGYPGPSPSPGPSPGPGGSDDDDDEKGVGDDKATKFAPDLLPDII